MSRQRFTSRSSRTRLVRSGAELCVALPEEVVARLRLSAGDTVYLRETGQGIELTLMDPSDEDTLRQSQESMRRYRQQWRFAGG